MQPHTTRLLSVMPSSDLFRSSHLYNIVISRILNLKTSNLPHVSNIPQLQSHVNKKHLKFARFPMLQPRIYYGSLQKAGLPVRYVFFQFSGSPRTCKPGASLLHGDNSGSARHDCSAASVYNLHMVRIPLLIKSCDDTRRLQVILSSITLITFHRNDFPLAAVAACSLINAHMYPSSCAGIYPEALK